MMGDIEQIKNHDFVKPLSLIIITYNRPEDALALLENISTLLDAEKLLQDVIVVNNASTSDYTAVENFYHPQLPVFYFYSKENLGVTKGRNFALQFSKGDICIFLDDDAVLQNTDALKNVIESFNKAGIDKRATAIVSFKVLYFSNLQMQVNALPHKQYNRYKNKNEFFTYFFAGGAHAIRRDVLIKVGGLPEEFFYGMEEYDLAYRILDQDYCIKYDSSIVMLHKESPLGRKPRADKLRMMWVNKSKVAWRYLPKRYFCSTSLMWSFEFLIKTGCNISGFIKGWKQIACIPSFETRTPAKQSTLDYLKKVEARLWY